MEKDNEEKNSQNVHNELITITKGAGFSFFGNVFGKISKFIITTLLTQILSINQFGLYSLGETILNFFSGIASLGLNRGALKHISAVKKKEDQTKIKGIIISAILFSSLAGIVSGILLYLFSGQIALFFKKPEFIQPLKIFAIGTPFLALLSVVADCTRGFKTTKYLVLGKIIFKDLIHLGIIGLFALLGFKLLGMIWAFIFSVLVSNIIILYYLKKIFIGNNSLKNIKAKFENKKLFSSSIPLMTESILISLVGWMDILMIGYFLPSSQVGIYRIVIMISMLTILFIQIFASIISPIVSEYFHNKQMKDLKKILKIITKWLFYLSIPIFLIIITSPKEILTIFGPNFKQGVLPLLILSTGEFLTIFSFGSSILLSMTIYQKSSVLIAGIGVLLNFSLNLLFLGFMNMGIEGAAIATSVALISISLLRLSKAKVKLGFLPFSTKTIMGFIGAGISLIIVFVIKHFSSFQIHYLLNLLLTFIIIISTFSAFIVITGIESEDKFLFKRILIKFKK